MSLMGEEGVVGFEEYDDDAYYLELRGRILLLMVDDEEDDLELFRNYGQISNSGTTRLEDKLVSLVSYRIPENFAHKIRHSDIRSHEAPSWMVNLWRNSNGSIGNGTGVFIPQVVKPRRRQRPGRKNNKSSGRRMSQQA